MHHSILDILDAETAFCCTPWVKDGSIFCRALSQHLREGGEAYVANHHNPKKCQARQAPSMRGERRTIMGIQPIVIGIYGYCIYIYIYIQWDIQPTSYLSQLSHIFQRSSYIPTIVKMGSKVWVDHVAAMEATLGFIRSAISIGLRLERLED